MPGQHQSGGSHFGYGDLESRVAAKHPLRLIREILAQNTYDTPDLVAHSADDGGRGATLPVVYRWAYTFGVSGAEQDFVPQNLPPEQVHAREGLERPRRATVKPAE